MKVNLTFFTCPPILYELYFSFLKFFLILRKSVENDKRQRVMIVTTIQLSVVWHFFVDVKRYFPYSKLMMDQNKVSINICLVELMSLLEWSAEYTHMYTCMEREREKVTIKLVYNMTTVYLINTRRLTNQKTNASNDLLFMELFSSEFSELPQTCQTLRPYFYCSWLSSRSWCQNPIDDYLKYHYTTFVP